MGPNYRVCCCVGGLGFNASRINHLGYPFARRTFITCCFSFVFSESVPGQWVTKPVPKAGLCESKSWQVMLGVCWFPVYCCGELAVSLFVDISVQKSDFAVRLSLNSKLNAGLYRVKVLLKGNYFELTAELTLSTYRQCSVHPSCSHLSNTTILYLGLPLQSPLLFFRWSLSIFSSFFMSLVFI